MHAGGLGGYGSGDSEDERSDRGSESSDTDDEELRHRIRQKQEAFWRKEREQQLLLEKQLEGKPHNTVLLCCCICLLLSICKLVGEKMHFKPKSMKPSLEIMFCKLKVLTKKMFELLYQNDVHFFSNKKKVQVVFSISYSTSTSKEQTQRICICVL